MFAVVRSGGKQFKVQQNSVVFVERLEVPKGDSIRLDQVLLVGTDGQTVFGDPFVLDSYVVATVEDHVRDEKIIVFKKKRRQNYRRKKGHRQLKTRLLVTEIVLKGTVHQAASSPKAVKAAPKKVVEDVVEASPKSARKKDIAAQ